MLSSSRYDGYAVVADVYDVEARLGPAMTKSTYGCMEYICLEDGLSDSIDSLSLH